MTDLAKNYTDKIFGGLRYLPTWLPSATVAVGDVARIEERTVIRHCGLENLNIEYSAHENAAVAHRGWASKGALAVSARAAATTGTPDVGANTRVEFNAKHAILFRAEQSRELYLENQGLIEDRLLHMRAEQQWEPDWVLITHVVRAARFTVLISQEKGASAELKLTGALAGAAAGLDSEDIGVDVVNTVGMAYDERGVVDATPLYRAIRVQKRRIRPPRTKRVKPTGRARAGADEYEIAEVLF
ncbi:MAG TPA: hypothetical protein VGY76_02565 [Solirubrobacteraceae bacterium]|nr:hypothetical protein [Solirubrobacteraceae bacterium]